MYKIVRNIDKLGRIVIPKNIRDILGINIGDDLTLELDEDKIILQLQDKGEKIKNYCDLICESIYEMTGCAAIVSKNNCVIKVAGISRALEGQEFQLDNNTITVSGKKIDYCKVLFSDILSKGIVFGRIYLASKTQVDSGESLQAVSDFMARYIGKLIDA